MLCQAPKETKCWVQSKESSNSTSEVEPTSRTTSILKSPLRELLIGMWSISRPQVLLILPNMVTKSSLDHQTKGSDREPSPCKAISKIIRLGRERDLWQQRWGWIRIWFSSTQPSNHPKLTLPSNFITYKTSPLKCLMVSIDWIFSLQAKETRILWTSLSEMEYRHWPSLKTIMMTQWPKSSCRQLMSKWFQFLPTNNNKIKYIKLKI